MRRCAWLLVGLLTLLVPDANAAFPGKPGRIAFSAQGPGGGGTVFTLKELDPRTKRVRPLTVPGCAAPDRTADGWKDRAPDYSPDGRHIAYLHSDYCPGSEAGERQGVWLMRADGSQARLLVPMSVAGLSYDYSPPGAAVAFSPDSRRIAVNYVDFNAQGGLFYVHRVFSAADGAPLHQRRSSIGEYEDGARGLDWSSVNRIAASSRGRVHILRPDGAGLRTLFTRPSWPSDSWPDWSPSGQTLVFTRDRTGDECQTCVGGGQIMRIAARRGRARVRLKDDYYYSPIVSPDARRIAFSDGHALSVMGTRRGRPRRLTRGYEFVGELDWQALR